MPLQKSKKCDKMMASRNISEMRKAGHPAGQSIAAGLNAAGCSRKKGGRRKV
jgi:hypothetical protein